MTQVRFGWLIRSIHAWCSNLVMALAFSHMFSTFFLKSYRKPRELTWVSGMLLLSLMLAFGFSGYLLPWNTLSYFATMVGTNIAGVLPGVGESVLRFLRGGDSITGSTLTRFFGFHVAILPVLTAPVLLLHLWLIQKQGMSLPVSLEEQHRAQGTTPPQIRFFPDFLHLREVVAIEFLQHRLKKARRLDDLQFHFFELAALHVDDDIAVAFDASHVMDIYINVF